MDSQEIIKFAKDNWLKAVIAIVVAVVLYFVAKKAIKSIRSGSENRQARREYANMSVEIENAGGHKSRLTSTQVSNIAAKVYNAVDGPGTDNRALVSAIKEIPTASDYYKVKAEYLGKYNEDMWQAILDDLDDGTTFVFSDLWDDYSDSYTLGQINSHLALIAVPVEMR